MLVPKNIVLKATTGNSYDRTYIKLLVLVKILVKLLVLFKILVTKMRMMVIIMIILGSPMS